MSTPQTAAAPSVSNAFEVFATQAPEYATAWQSITESLNRACALDPKTKHLAYLAVLAAAGLHTGVPFHVHLAKRAGASQAEVISAVLLGLQPAGHGVIGSLPVAIDAYDHDPSTR